jgi:hypothetical protein
MIVEQHDEVHRACEQLQAFLRRLGAIELVDVQELFPPALAGGRQRQRRGELDDELPGAGRGPVVESAEDDRIILVQGRVEL